MSRICLLTDSTAQFTRPDFPGHEQVFVISLGIEPVEPQVSLASTHLVAPKTQDFLHYYSHLSKEFDAVLVLVLSAQLHSTIINAQKASQLYNNHASIQVIDSQTTATGLGVLVETAAGAIASGASLAEVERLVRSVINRIYMLICIPELTRLEGLGLLSHTQALVGEMLGMLPIFMLEDGRLAPLEKARTPRHLFESFQEFMAEFTTPQYVALLRGSGQTMLRTRPLRQYVQETFPNTPFSEHTFNPHLTALFGKQSLGLMVMEPITP